MKLEVLSKETNATNWIIMGLRRRIENIETADEETCKDVAKELNMEFKIKEDGNYYFGDKQWS